MQLVENHTHTERLLILLKIYVECTRLVDRVGKMQTVALKGESQYKLYLLKEACKTAEMDNVQQLQNISTYIEAYGVELEKHEI